jgi:glycosyltransferase involved in cell wall biosynthesis
MRPTLWWSNSPTVGTGYGTQSKQVIDRLAFLTHVEVAANYGVEGTPQTYVTPQGVRVPLWPRSGMPFSQDVIMQYWERFVSEHPDGRFIMLADAFVVPDSVTSSVEVDIWVPVEHVPCPPDLMHIFGRDESKARAIAMSKFGQQELAKGAIPSTYIPHGIESTFHATNGGGELMGVSDDAYVVAMVAANKGAIPIRKSWGQAFVAFSKAAKKHDDMVLYCHTDPNAIQSVTLHDLAKTLGITDKVIFADRARYNLWGYTEQDLAAIYTRADIILSPSMGEGFGLCPLEAAACGTPAIVSDFSAQPELACEDSYLVEGQLEWHQGRRAFLFTPYIGSITEALNDAYDKSVKSSQSALDLAAQYDADRVWQEYWLPFLRGERTED